MLASVNLRHRTDAMGGGIAAPLVRTEEVRNEVRSETNKKTRIFGLGYTAGYT